jgi:hypothetical protein
MVNPVPEASFELFGKLKVREALYFSCNAANGPKGNPFDNYSEQTSLLQSG